MKPDMGHGLPSVNESHSVSGRHAAGFSTKRAALDFWHDTIPGKNDRARFVKEAGRWFIEVQRGWDWIRRDWREYVKAKAPYVEVNAETAYGRTTTLPFSIRVF